LPLELVVTYFLTPLFRFGPGQTLLPVGLEPVRRYLSSLIVVCRDEKSRTHLESRSSDLDLFPRSIPDSFVLCFILVILPFLLLILQSLRLLLDKTKEDLIFFPFPFWSSAQSQKMGVARTTHSFVLLARAVLSPCLHLHLPRGRVSCDV